VGVAVLKCSLSCKASFWGANKGCWEIAGYASLSGHAVYSMQTHAQPITATFGVPAQPFRKTPTNTELVGKIWMLINTQLHLNAADPAAGL